MRGDRELGLSVPEEARRRLLVRFGETAGPWCDALPGTVRELAGRWSLTPVEQLGGGTSRVYRCLRRDGSAAYLKLTPDPLVARQEAEALRLWSGGGHTPEPLDADAAAGVLLLAGVTTDGGEPAPPLSAAGVGDGRTLPRRIAPLLTALRACEPGRGGVLPDLAERVDFVFALVERRTRLAAPQVCTRLSGPLRAGLAAARTLARTGPVRLVHGDLHAGNVLDTGAGRGLIAIDPRPCVGDPDFDAVDWALYAVADDASLHERIAQLASLVPGLDADRLLRWCAALAVLDAAPVIARGAADGRTAWLMSLPRLVGAST